MSALVACAISRKNTWQPARFILVDAGVMSGFRKQGMSSEGQYPDAVMPVVTLAELAAASHDTPESQHSVHPGWPLIRSVILI